MVAGLAIAGAFFYVAVMIGSNAYDFFAAGKWTGASAARAQMAHLDDLDLSTRAGSLADLSEALSAAEYVEPSSSEINVQEYRWFRGAVRVRAAGNIPIRIEVGASRTLEFLPLDRPRFPGSFLGLKIGDPTPSDAQAAELRKRASACCDASLLDWRSFAGHVVGIDYQRKVMRFRSSR
jgi:hypothetical protein